MTTSQVKSIIAALFLGTLSACSAKIDATSDGGGGGTNTPFENPTSEPTLTDPTGNWDSGCVVYYDGKARRTYLAIAQGKFSSRVLLYSSNACVQSDFLNEELSSGNFKMIGASGAENGSYKVDIETVDEGMTFTMRDLVRIEKTRLFLGDFTSPQVDGYPSRTDRSQPYTKIVTQ